jgi:hypothetical protein
MTNANTANLTASGLIAGAYVFRLTVTDNQGATGFDDVNVTVSSNTPPTANAGADKAVTLPANSVVINGTGSDPGGSISTYAWTRQSGPNTPTLSGANTANLTVSGMIAGTYVYRLTVTDNGGLTGFDDVNIVVSSAPTTNIALNKVTTVSSVEAAGTPGSAAVDGNATSRWSSAFADPQWIYVDLAASYNVSRVKITWEGAYGRDYLVQVSANASTWTTIKTVTGNTVLVNDHTGLSGIGRYVRIYGTARGTVYGYSIFELEVYGTSAGARMATQDIYFEEDAESEISFYPNPAKDFVYVKGLKNGTPVSMITTDSRIISKEVADESIDIRDMPSGLYVLYAHDGLRAVRSKVLIE